MQGRLATAGVLCRAGVALVALSALGCVSSSDLESIRTQLTDIQVQVLELKKDGPSKTDVADLRQAIGDQLEILLRSQADVRTDLKALAGRIEQFEDKLDDTNFRLTQLSQQIEATNQELQAIRRAAEEARARTTAPAAVANPTDPQALYDAAYNDYLEGNYDLATLGFHQYAETYRGTELADNATYWIGECYYRQGEFQQAIEQFDVVLTRFERSDRTPSALLKKGYAYFELGQRAQGIVHLQNVIRDYAGTDEAHLASQRLNEIGID